MSVRLLRDDQDGPAVARLERLCDHRQAGSAYFLDRTPAPLARYTAFPSYQALIAEESGSVVGVICAAREELLLAGRQTPCSYLFDLKVAPAARGQRHGRELLDRAVALSAARGDSLAYQIVEGSSEAIGRAERSGFHRLAELASFSRVLLRRPAASARKMRLAAAPAGPRPAAEASARPTSAAVQCRVATRADVPAILDLLTRCHAAHSLAPRFDLAWLEGLASRSPGFGVESFVLAEHGGELRAALSHWDATPGKRLVYTRLELARWRRVVRRLANPLRQALGWPALVREGLPVSLVKIRHSACSPGNEPVFTELLGHLTRLMFGQRVQLLMAALDRRSPLCAAFEAQGFLARPFALAAMGLLPGLDVGTIAQGPVFVDAGII